ncbi:MAG: hypothetical protein EXX96DRAFT_568141 [Benjaminiella poitrasii]|nr:MAG: hypothetical protein EXX96DRAFT_568141 [Benjaminiella poitrasii]
MFLFEKLCAALDENEIDELGLLPILPELNELPADSQKYYPLIVVESKLGIDIASFTTLLKESHEYFIRADNGRNDRAVERATRIMILLKPDNHTAMNRRKKLITSGYINVKNELALIELIFTIPKNAKSSLAWYHRQWILTNYYTNKTINAINEISLCRKASTIYPRNYYAWTYRYWFIFTYCDTSMFKEEYQKMCEWIELNISDNSGFQYLQQIMTHNELNLDQHMQWLDQLIIRYPGHESLWYHRRFCSSIFSIKSAEYCKAQHQYVHDIFHDRFNHQSMSNNPDDIVMQKEFALRFGLWQILLVINMQCMYNIILIFNLA